MTVTQVHSICGDHKKDQFDNSISGDGSYVQRAVYSPMRYAPQRPCGLVTLLAQCYTDKSIYSFRWLIIEILAETNGDTVWMT